MTILKEPTTIIKNQTTILNILTTILNVSTKSPHISTTDLDIPTIFQNILTTNIITTIQNAQIMTTSLSVNSNQDCTKEEILKNQCKGKISSEQIKDIYNELISRIIPKVNKEIETQNVIVQLSTLEELKNNNYPNASSIDLGECEQRLMEQEGLFNEKYLIIFKIDIKSPDLSSTYVQYEIYNLVTLELISLEVCKDIPISVSVPVNLDESIKSNYYSLSQSGYNLFDLSDSFYNDICSTYTTENGTDLTLIDRKNLIYDTSGNVSMCQDGCTFQSYNLTTKKANCDCAVQISETETDVSKIKFDKNELADSFFNTLKNSNFLVLKCFKLVFSKKGQKKNIGSYLMSGITFIFIILMFIYMFNGSKKLDFYIQTILKFKLNYDKENKKKLSFKSAKIGNLKKNNSTKNNNRASIKKDKKEKKSIKKIDKNKNLKKNQKKSSKKAINNKSFPPKKKSINNVHISKKSHEDIISSSTNSQEKENLKNKLLKIKNNIRKSLDNKKIGKKNTINSKKQEKIPIIKNTKMYLDKYKIKELNDEELNDLEYELAILIDKRTYFQYYNSLIKKKHLILFAFYPANDYNLIAVKISLLLLSFSLYFTINGFFFSDSTMNKINEDKGAYNIIYQLPQILYSTIISAIINVILKRLSLSEKQILYIKQESDFLKAQKKSNNIKNCLKIKLAIFFIFSFLLMIFFWYFISCFCAVYKNTQEILIKDTLISFALSMIYPFGLNLLPGMFRIPALRSITKDKKCFYKISGLVALI